MSGREHCHRSVDHGRIDRLIVRFGRDFITQLARVEQCHHDLVIVEAGQCPVVRAAAATEPAPVPIDRQRRGEDDLGLRDRIHAEARPDRLAEAECRVGQLAGEKNPIKITIREYDRQKHP